MPFGTFINAIPAPVFMVIHAAAFLIGAVFARRAFGAGARDLGWAFTLYCLAEVSYFTYHMDWTVFLFAHTVSEVLDLLAVIVLFMGISRRVLTRAGR